MLYLCTIEIIYEKYMEKIVLGRNEMYDAIKLNCWDFCKGSDVREGIELKFGNMLTCFPFQVNGINFKCSEFLYLCGQFSTNDEECIEIQKEIVSSNNGFSAKKFIRNKHMDKVRPDFNDFRIQWMFWVVWQKSKGNTDFQKLLLSIPDDAIIIENSSWQTSKTATVWGCKNMELRRIRSNVKEEIENISGHMKKKDVENLLSIELNNVNKVGTFIGENNLGKILMLCREALKNNREPDIDYDLLSKYNIYLFGTKLF